MSQVEVSELSKQEMGLALLRASQISYIESFLERSILLLQLFLSLTSRETNTQKRESLDMLSNTVRLEHSLVMAKPKYCWPARFIYCVGNRVTHGSHRQANPPITDEEIQKESDSK